MSTTLIPVDQIAPTPLNPRKIFDQAKLEELAVSMRARGQLQPIVVRPLGDRFEVVCGERRWRAASLAGLESIECSIRELDDDGVLEVAVIENAQREDVHPLEEAEGYKALLDRGKITVAELAAKVGKSESHIHRRVRMCDLIDEVKEAFLADDIQVTHVRHLLPLPPAAQAEAMTYLLYGLTWSNSGSKQVRADRRPGPTNVSPVTLASYIKEHFNFKLAEAVFDTTDPELVKKAPACTACPQRTGAQTHLFSEAPGPDTCLNNDCFRSKILAHCDQIADGLRKDGETAIYYLGGGWSTDQKDGKGRHWLGEYCYEIRSDKANAKGIVHDVRGKRIGQVLDIYAKTKSHKAPMEKTKEEYDYEQAKHKHKIKLAHAFRTRLRTAIEENLPKSIDVETLRAMAAADVHRSYQCSHTVKLLRLSNKDYIDTGEAKGILQRHIAAADEPALIRITALIKVADDLAIESWQDDVKCEGARAMAKTLGLEPDSILEAVRAEHPAPEKPKPKPKAEPAKPAKAAKAAKAAKPAKSTKKKEPANA